MKNEPYMPGKRGWLLSIAVLIAGCSAATYYGVSGDYTPDSKPGEGLVALSTRWVFSCPPPGLLPQPAVNPFLFFEGAGPRSSVLLDNPLVARHFENPPGYFYVLSNKAGNYRMTEIAFMHGALRYESTKELGAPFQVREGKVTYLGEIAVTVSDCKVSDGKGEARIRVKAVDQWPRDRELFVKRLPKIGTDQVVVDILRP